jgi:hypothetical protein
MNMRDEALWRQVALVSYGTQILRKSLALEDWYRHAIFFGARFQFRALAGNALLAADFTLWLSTLRQAGATRLSLHCQSTLAISAFHIFPASALSYMQAATRLNIS